MKVLFVCLGNICRSPLAKGIMREKIRKKGLEAEVDSAGFEAFHIGDRADPRAIQIAARHDLDITDHIARKFRIGDFDRYDRIYVMDSFNYSDVTSVARNGDDRKKVDYIMNLAHPGKNMPVPDPYYGGKHGFENVYQLLDRACEQLALEIADKQRGHKE